MSHFRSLTIFDLLTVRHFIRKDLPGNLQCPARLSDFNVQHSPANPVDPLLRSAGQKSVGPALLCWWSRTNVTDHAADPCREGRCPALHHGWLNQFVFSLQQDQVATVVVLGLGFTANIQSVRNSTHTQFHDEWWPLLST